MATTIVFTDATGAVTLSNGMPVPADRFDKWAILPPIVPDKNAAVVYRVGSGQLDAFVFRTDYGASFEWSKIARSKQSDFDRFLRHIMSGGQFQVNTGDASSHSYATCGLWPESTPAFDMSDQTMMEYTLRVSILNLADTPGPLLCQY